MTVRLELCAGGEIELVQTDGQRVTLLSPEPAPTGATLQLRFPSEPLTLQVKVRTCRRVAAGSPLRFSVEGRFVNLGRAQRQRLLEPAD
jgi:hypothetical protein